MEKATDSTGLTFRQDYFADDKAWSALVSLLSDTFGIDLDPLKRLGGADPTSMPFGWFDESGLLVANISAFAMPVVINGRRINAAGLQSGAVRPPWRGRGLYRDLTRKALDWCEAEGFEAIVLYTDKPALYTPYGFRGLPMHLHAGAAPGPAMAAMPARTLDPWKPEDLALLLRALTSRTPVSDALAVCGSSAMFLINTQFDPDVRLSWLEDRQAVIAWKVGDNNTFVLSDIIAETIPPLDAILGGLGIAPLAIEVLFSPDKLGWQGEARPIDGGTRFMIRAGADISLDRPATLSPMADF
ncbi:GNAT family N-acetyltransferase [Rhizobium sp. AN80A]|uniref:GNAT family N-acetyltransferase n=1 Tax=Rhizobium sp. AN80A TaxID=3040673 RepID=UPI0024B3A7A3|nr:GNAT family N-acetyltransferase [Rhizobium sp. AN80A]